jgi:hypothetical protein
MSKQKTTEAEYEPTDAELHHAMHADPNRPRWDSGVTAPPSEQPTPPEEIGGGANLPKATGLNPPGCAIDDDDLLLVVHGLNFTSDTLIVFDDVAIVTEYESETKLNCSLHPSAFTEARGYPVTVNRRGYVAPVATMFTVTEAAAAEGTQRKHRKR